MDFGYVATAMVTPFNKEGMIDAGKTKELIDYLLANGTDALVVCGTTGESPTLQTDEKLTLFKLCIDYVKKRVPVIAGTGSNDTKASIELTKKATDIGADGIMLVTPYYNKPSQKGLYEHFKEIAAVTPLPIMLYNVPGRTAINMEADTTIALSKIKNITAVKEACGSLDQMAEIISGTDGDFHLYSGDDSFTLPALSIGATGVVSVASHVIGKEMQTMVSSFKGGDVQKAAEIHRALLPTMNALFIAPNPTCVKFALKKKGIDTGEVRLPLVPLSPELQQEVEQHL
ncbi:4-hydroxy-tetrahydrodipicolinate synthase [bacterium LRH843]|nr:4-hydroxy-tetrahydrodipicolinate synthase [bacterium LRH843]